MPLFPKDAEMSDDVSGFAPRRMLWTRELGTRKLLGGLGIIAVLWFGFLQVHDSMLLKTQWPQLTANSNGMTLVGTLNSRDSYERNLLKIIMNGTGPCSRTRSATQLKALFSRTMSLGMPC